MVGKVRRVSIRSLLLLVAALLPAGFGAIAAAAGPPPVEAYAHPPMAQGMTLSPDGTHVAFLAPVGGELHLVIAELGAQPGTAPVVVPPGPWRLTSVDWVNEERLVVGVDGTTTVRSRSGTVPVRVTQLLAVDRTGGNALVLFRNEGDLRFAGFGGAILQFLDREHLVVVAPFGEDGPDVVKVNVYTGDHSRVARGVRDVGGYLPDPSGQVRLATRLRDKTQETVFLVRDRPGETFQELKRLGLSDPSFAFIGFGDDPNRPYVSSAHEGGLSAIYEYDLATRSFGAKVAEDPDFDIGDPIIIDRKVVGVRYVRDMPTQIFFDPELQKLRDGFDRALPDSVETIVDRTRDGNFVLIASYHPQQPVTYRLYDRKRNELSFFADTFPKIPGESIGRREPVSYAARDGLTVPGYLTLPPGHEGRNLPFIVMPHGGPLSRDTQIFDNLSQFLVSRGYGVLQPNFRGSPGYGDGYLGAGFNEFGGKMIDDIADGARWAVAEGYADPARMCILGWSYGGYAALMTAIKEPDLFKCAVATAPVTNMARLWREFGSLSRYTEFNRTIYFGDDPDVLLPISPVHQVDRLQAPVMLIHGTMDAQAYFDHSEDMAKALRKAGKPFEFLEIEDMDHSPDTTEQMAKVMSAWEAFLAKHIGR